jgi:hypothetical protein
MATIKRSQFKSFLNTNTPGSPTWSLIGDGVSAALIAMNPTVESSTYIHEDNATVTLEGYGPTMSVEQVAKKGDEVFDYLDAIRKSRALLDSAETELVNVWLYETPSLSFYYAEKQDVSIQVDDFGGDGGKSTMLNYTINFVGNPVKGMYNPATESFIAAPVLAELATLAIGGVTLSPLFATDKGWLYYTGSVANGVTTATMNSTCTAPGAVVVQYDEATPVTQGNTASLAVGVNNLSVEVTVGAEVVTYIIQITRAAS